MNFLHIYVSIALKICIILFLKRWFVPVQCTKVYISFEEKSILILILHGIKKNHSKIKMQTICNIFNIQVFCFKISTRTNEYKRFTKVLVWYSIIHLIDTIRLVSEQIRLDRLHRVSILSNLSVLRPCIISVTKKPLVLS